jgi:hypothetical protein
MQAEGVIIDAGSSYSHASDDELKRFLTFISTKKSDCTYLNYVITCPCSGSPNLDDIFPELELELGTTDSAVRFKFKGS